MKKLFWNDLSGNTKIMLIITVVFLTGLVYLTSAGFSQTDTKALQDDFVRSMDDSGNDLSVVKKKLDKLNNVNFWSAWGSPLSRAIDAGNAELVKFLINHGADVNFAMPDGSTPLMWAAENFNIDPTPIIKSLLAAGANIDAKDRNGNNALHHALRTQHESPDEMGLRVGFLRQFNGEMNKIKTLLKMEIDVDHANAKQFTPLMEAISCYNLAYAGPNGYSTKLDNTNIPYRKEAVIYALIQAGADTRHSTDFGLGPIHLLAACGYVDILENLLKAGADPDPVSLNKDDPLNGSPISNASCLVYTDHAGVRKSGDIVLTLLKHGAKPDIPNDKGETALMHMAKCGLGEAVYALIANGAEVNRKSRAGETALMAAVSSQEEGASQVINALIKGGANTQLTNKLGKTAMQLALEANNTAAVNLLNQAIPANFRKNAGRCADTCLY